MLEGNRLCVYEGGYDDYLVERERQAQEKEGGTKTRRVYRRPVREGQRAQHQAIQRLAALEGAISDLEMQLEALAAELEKAAAGRQLDRVRQLGLEYSSAEADLQRHLAEWADLVDE